MMVEATKKTISIITRYYLLLRQISISCISDPLLTNDFYFFVRFSFWTCEYFFNVSIVNFIIYSSYRCYEAILLAFFIIYSDFSLLFLYYYHLENISDISDFIWMK